MKHWLKITDFIPVKEAFIKKVRVADKDICLVNDGEQFYAIAAKCPHAGADLSQGWCVEKQIVCPVHRFKYDLKTGKGAAGQGDYIDTFPVEVRADGIYVQIKKRWSLF